MLKWSGATLAVTPFVSSFGCRGDKGGVPLGDLNDASAAALASAIRAGQVSSQDVVSAYIERIEAVNTALNAAVQVNFEGALAEAGS